MQPLDALAAPGPILAASEGGASGRAAAAARGLCGALAAHGGELARVAGGGSVSAATIAAAALVAADALDVLDAAPLAPYWRGSAFRPRRMRPTGCRCRLRRRC